ncbi:MAG: NfeD family protein [Butyrivibrio sp.]|nr:NfeD family protein [Butyrivibrio sp.]
MNIISTAAAFWLILTVILAIVELATVGLVTIWFAAGSFIAMFFAAFGASIPVQIAVFALVSVICIAAVRPLAAKYLNNNVEKTNIDSIIGKRLVVKVEIDNLKESGKVDFEGSTWLARSEDNNITIPEGAEVTVVRVEGNKLIVKRDFM